MSSQGGKDIELDAVGCEFEPYFTGGCVFTAAPLWCGLGCCCRTVWVNKATGNKGIAELASQQE